MKHFLSNLLRATILCGFLCNFAYADSERVSEDDPRALEGTVYVDKNCKIDVNQPERNCFTLSFNLDGATVDKLEGGDIADRFSYRRDYDSIDNVLIYKPRTSRLSRGLVFYTFEQSQDGAELKDKDSSLVLVKKL